LDAFEYYRNIDPKYHDEVYELLEVVERDTVFDTDKLAHDAALKRLEELTKLSSTR
jgi:hypothetical protein